MTDPSSPPRPARTRPEPPPDREGRPVSFYLAVFLALLLFISGGLNVILLLVAVGTATSGLTGYSEADDAAYEMVAVGGDVDARSRILRIPVQGAISEAASPVIGARGGTVSELARALRAAAQDSSIVAVLLDIDSPGGGVTDSDELHRLVTTFRAKHGKPVLALLGDIAASGGYYLAVASDRIMARSTSITGSIGVIMQSWNFAEAADKLGIDQTTITSDSTPYKDMMSPMRPLRDDERNILRSIVEEFYQRFVDVVDAGRAQLDRAQVQRLADGRI
jgi:protease-4